jgi:coenzyme F420-reducing hydrogenase delta subunit
LSRPVDGYGLAGLFPPDLTGYHDGGCVPVSAGLELVRAMLRDNGAWCRLEVEDQFFVHVGFDQYVYVGSAVACEQAVALTHERGLFAEPIDASPWATEVADDASVQRRPADAAWWAGLGSLVAERGPLMLEEGYVASASRWHRVTAADIDLVRARLTPRSRLLVWPDLSTDVDSVLAGLASDGLIELVWQERDGRITSWLVEDDHAELPALLAGARAALVVSCPVDQCHPVAGRGTARRRWCAACSVVPGMTFDHGRRSGGRRAASALPETREREQPSVGVSAYSDMVRSTGPMPVRTRCRTVKARTQTTSPVAPSTVQAEYHATGFYGREVYSEQPVRARGRVVL